MKKILKWIGIVLGGLVIVLLLAAIVLYFVGSARLNKTFAVQPEDVPIPTDEASIARGQHLVDALTFCKGCHGDDLGGDLFDDEPMIDKLYAPNLTSGSGGAGTEFSNGDFVRAIRHGVDPEGRGLLIMHSNFYHNLSQQDLGDIIAYVKSVPPVDKELPEPKIEPLGKILVALGVFDSEALPLIPAEVIDQNAPFAQVPSQGETAEYGGYLVSISLCEMCHGADMAGGPPLEEGMLPGPNLTPGGELIGWSEDDFVKAMTTGVTPSGHQLNSEFMPWDVYSNLTGSELKSLWLYLQSLPALSSNN